MSKTDNIAFYDPKHIGCFDLGVTQKNKVIPFKTIEGVFLTGSKVSLNDNMGGLIKEYTLTDGLNITGTNAQGQEKTLNLVLQGSDFLKYKGMVLNADCNFFVDGDIEVQFDLQIK